MVKKECMKHKDEAEKLFADWFEDPTSYGYKYYKYVGYEEALERLLKCECGGE